MRYVTILLLSFFLTAVSLNDARKANSAFERGNYAEAVDLYRQAISQDPDNARLYFNLAKSLYELGQGDAAIEAYDRFKTLTESPAERSFADYNKGRMLTDQENYQEAINFFREALKNNPNDIDAKFNYELAVKRQQQQEQDPQSESGDGEDDPESSDQQDNQQDQDPDQDSESNRQPGQPEPEDGESQEQPRPLEMTPEEAQNILDALQQLERELLENQKKESTDPPSRNEKDW
jgi:Ca-activated chloride channel family protein